MLNATPDEAKGLKMLAKWVRETEKNGRDKFQPRSFMQDQRLYLGWAFAFAADVLTLQNKLQCGHDVWSLMNVSQFTYSLIPYEQWKEAGINPLYWREKYHPKLMDQREREEVGK